MPIRPTDIVMGIVLAGLMTGPYWWMNWLTDKQNERYGRAAFHCLIPLAFLLTFGLHSDFWNPRKVVFSNDGGGVDYSRWLQEAVPGESTWQDNYWLGSPIDIPLNFSYIIRGLGYRPNLILIILGFVAMFYGLTKPIAPKEKTDANIWKDRFKGWK